jgi:hypothetical protein
MKRFNYLVNPLFFTPLILRHAVLCAPFCGEANYSKAFTGLARSFLIPSANSATNNAAAPNPISKW